MPVEHKTYGCQFKCGRRHSPNRAIIYQHELNCWYNLEVKSCVTCKYGNIEWGGYSENRSTSYRTCDLDEDEVIVWDGIKPQVNCERWEVNPAWLITSR